MFQIPGITSNILRNKSALVIGICTTLTCFQTLRPRKRGFRHETGFSLLFRIERASILIYLKSSKCGDIHTSKISQMSLASGAGYPGWSRTRPKLVSCQVWWLRSSKDTDEFIFRSDSIVFFTTELDE